MRWKVLPVVTGASVLCLVANLAWTQPSEILVQNGTIVTSEESIVADVLIRDGRIAAIGSNLTVDSTTRQINADGLLVLPGGVDPHVHLGGNRVDDYTSGSAAALAGGITTISNFIGVSDEASSVSDPLRRAAEEVRAEAIADVILHPIIGRPEPVPAQLEDLAASGHTSLKVFMVRPGFDRDVPGFLNMLNRAGEVGMMTMIHAEDAAIVSPTGERFIAEGRGALQFYPDARPVLAEVAATQRAVAYSEATGSPIYLVHLSSEGALRVAEDAQARGLPVYVETRPIYLHLTRERPAGTGHSFNNNFCLTTNNDLNNT